MLLDWGKLVLLHLLGTQGHLFKHHDFRTCMEGHWAWFADSQARGTGLFHLFASHSGGTGHFPPAMLTHFALACEARPGCREV